MGSRKIEMHWTCSACGQQNLGRHTVCQRCGDPKGKDEPYRMPGDTAAAPTVSDPALLRIANAGANWRCAYCGSDQRRFDGACNQCGASQASGRSTAGEGAPVPPAHPPPSAAYGRPRTRSAVFLWVGLGVVAMLLGTCCIGILFRAPRGSSDGFGHVAAESAAELPPPRVVEGVVSRVSWEHVVSVERRRLVDHEGFAEARPADALEVRADGERVHHHDRVQDGTETEHYTERVPYEETEWYTERVQCGETCTETPRHCSEHCRPDDNGFATCTTTCTGGDRNCSPRHCDERRSRQVTRHRDEPRTRQVPRYRQVPRQAPWFRWRVWEWTPDRDVTHRGSTEPPTWPSDEELRPPVPLSPGEEERTSRSATYRAFLRFDGTREHEEQLQSVEELARFAPATRWRIEVQHHGGTRVLGAAAPEVPPGTAPAPTSSGFVVEDAGGSVPALAPAPSPATTTLTPIGTP